MKILVLVHQINYLKQITKFLSGQHFLIEASGWRLSDISRNPHQTAASAAHQSELDFLDFDCVIADGAYLNAIRQKQPEKLHSLSPLLLVANMADLGEYNQDIMADVFDVICPPIKRAELLWRLDKVQISIKNRLNRLEKNLEKSLDQEGINSRIAGEQINGAGSGKELINHNSGRAASTDVESIAQNQYLFRSLVEGIRDYAIFMLDADGRVATWNTGACRILWYEATEILGQHFSCFYPEDDIKTGKPGQELQLVATAGQCEDEGWRRRADGSYFWANMTITALKDEKGARLGFAAIVHDLSDRAAIESELCSLNRALSTICSCHQAIVRAETETQLLQDICQLIVQIGKYPLAWIVGVGLKPTPTQLPVPTPTYASTLGDNSKRDQIALELIASSSEPVYTALKTASPCIIQNIATDSGGTFRPLANPEPKAGATPRLELNSKKSSLICLPLCHTGGLLESGNPESGDGGRGGRGDLWTRGPGEFSESPRLPVSPSPLACPREGGGLPVSPSPGPRVSPSPRLPVQESPHLPVSGAPHPPSCLGVLAIYATEAEAFDPQEIELLTELAADLAHGVLALRTRDRSRRTEAALRSSEERYRQLVEMLPDTILIHQQSQVEYINPAGVKLLGLDSLDVSPTKGIKGRQLSEIVHPLTIPILSNMGVGYSSAINSPTFQEQTLQRIDGTEINIEIASIPFHHHFQRSGDALGSSTEPASNVSIGASEGVWLTIARDITLRKQAQWALEQHRASLEDLVQLRTQEKTKLIDTLRESEERLRTLINALPDIVCFKDSSGRWEIANQAMLEAFGLVDFDYRYHTDSELANLLSPQKQAMYALCFQKSGKTDARAWKRRAPNHSEEVIPSVEGKARTFDVIKIPLFYPDNSPKGLVVIGRDITDRVAAEEAMRRMASIVESSEDGIIGKSSDGTIRTWNAGAQRIYGYTAAEVIGRSIAVLALPQRAREVPQLMERIRQGSSIHHYETVHQRQDGRKIHVSLTISPIKDGRGRITGASTIARDITDLKRVEAALERLRHQNELILNSAGEGICGLDREGKITFVNPAAAKMLGMNMGELLKVPFSVILDPKQAVSMPLEGGDLWTRGLGDLWTRGPGEFSESPRLECSPSPHLPISPSPHLPVSPSRMLPVSPSRMLPVSPSPHLPISQSPVSPIYEALKNGHFTHATDQLFYRKDGTAFPVEYISTPIHEQGKIVGVVVTFKDITERQAIERMKDEFISVVSHELRTPLTSLRGALGLLTGDILKAQPDRQARMLEIAISNTERLVRLINDILDLERIQSGAESMRRESCNAADLMLQASEALMPVAEKAGVRVCVEPVAVRLLVNPDRVIQTLTNLLSNAIKFSPAGGTVWMGAVLDSGALEPRWAEPRKSLGAVRHGDDRGNWGPRAAELAEAGAGGLLTSPTFPPNQGQEKRVTYLTLYVKDQGRGIPPDKLESIFGRFQQVDASDSRKKGGTGLGLAICRGIVEHHGGQIWATSAMPDGDAGAFGEGSVFYLTLPLDDA